tara:strand:- start:1856 stop:2344 length:489 start_codon:yes stop_codon:yes gene_type:complete
MGIKEKGYRLNVGIIVANSDGKLLYCKRKNSDNWQFPQGGIDRNEDPFLAALRELYEEVGIQKDKVNLIKESENWYKYDLPRKYKKNNFLWNDFKGQKQKWFLFKLIEEVMIDLNNENNPEFDEFDWVDYWKPLDEIVEFKREIYKKVLSELESAYKLEFDK